MNQLIAELQAAGQDHEFYPTTDEIIAELLRDLNGLRDVRGYRYEELRTALDIGAGSGKVLRALKKSGGIHTLYAMEKSAILCERLDADIFIVGTDFKEQSLLSKSVDVIFTNPPYSEFEEWTIKVIREAAAKVVYLVIPIRWAKSDDIKKALEFRQATAESVGTFSFLEAEDRAARAVVDLVRVEIPIRDSDPFTKFFDEQFADFRQKFKEAATAGRASDPATVKSEASKLVPGANYPERMVALYNEEMDKVRKNYDLVRQLDVELLKEFDVTPDRILECLRNRLNGLRNAYWRELFSCMRQITDRLTCSRRMRMLNTLQKHGGVDFTVPNIHAVVLWSLKNANNDIEEQLIEVFENMVEQANVKNYKSNQRVFEFNRWRYSETKPTHVALEYRLVIERCGGIERTWQGEGLSERGAAFLGDLLTVANNLGFLCNTADPRLTAGSRESGSRQWRSGTLEKFTTKVNGKEEILFEARAYLKGNIHLRLNQKFALALNVEMGRLKGWLRDAQEAAEELQDKQAAAFFQKNLRLGAGSLLMLGGEGQAVA